MSEGVKYGNLTGHETREKECKIFQLNENFTQLLTTQFPEKWSGPFSSPLL